jgi:hypothetical protein
MAEGWVVSGQIAQDERGELAGPGILRSRRSRYSRTCAGAWQRPGPTSAMR